MHLHTLYVQARLVAAAKGSRQGGLVDENKFSKNTSKERFQTIEVRRIKEAGSCKGLGLLEAFKRPLKGLLQAFSKGLLKGFYMVFEKPFKGL